MNEPIPHAAFILENALHYYRKLAKDEYTLAYDCELTEEVVENLEDLLDLKDKEISQLAEVIRGYQGMANYWEDGILKLISLTAEKDLKIKSLTDELKESKAHVDQLRERPPINNILWREYGLG